MSCSQDNCRNLLLLAAVVAFQLAQGRSADDLSLMSAFFEVLGDDLALLAICAPQDNS